MVLSFQVFRSKLFTHFSLLFHVRTFSFSVSNYSAFCEEDHQCVMDNMRCDIPKCVCKKYYKWDSSKCVNSQGMSSLGTKESQYHSIEIL